MKDVNLQNACELLQSLFEETGEPASLVLTYDGTWRALLIDLARKPIPAPLLDPNGDGAGLIGVGAEPETALAELDDLCLVREGNSGNGCPECARSYGPWYVGPCEHGDGS